MNCRTLLPNLLLLASLALASPTCASNMAQADEPRAPMLNAQISSFGVLTEDLQRDLGFTCLKDEQGRVRVDKVRLGSEAQYGGVQNGDQILSAAKDGPDVTLSIERDGHTFQIHLQHMAPGEDTSKFAVRLPRPDSNTTPFPLNAQQFGGQPPLGPEFAQPDGRRRRRRRNPMLDVQPQNYPVSYVIDPDKIKVLANYNIEFVVDRSLSMRARDCPGGLSRWDWCGYQTADIAKALAPFASTGITITPFAMQFDVFEHCTPQNIVDVFDRHNFELGTRLCEPLSQRLHSYFEHHRAGDKPLLITVITDGMPWPKPEPDMVKAELVSASRAIKEPGEVTIVFFQIGGRDPIGRNYLVDLGSNLTQYGARTQFVQTRTFEELESIGLAQALVQAVQQYSPPSNMRSRPAKEPAGLIPPAALNQFKSFNPSP